MLAGRKFFELYIGLCLRKEDNAGLISHIVSAVREE
jgi:hypothetical protein